MSQVSNWMKLYISKYTYLLKIKTYEDKLKWLLVKSNNFPSLIFLKTFFDFFIFFYVD